MPSPSTSRNHQKQVEENASHNYKNGWRRGKGVGMGKPSKQEQMLIDPNLHHAFHFISDCSSLILENNSLIYKKTMEPWREVSPSAFIPRSNQIDRLSFTYSDNDGQMENAFFSHKRMSSSSFSGTAPIKHFSLQNHTQIRLKSTSRSTGPPPRSPLRHPSNRRWSRLREHQRTPSSR